MNNEKYTQTNSTNEPVHCKDCQHLMFPIATESVQSVI